MDALFFRGRRTRRIMRSTEVVHGGVDAEGTSPSAVSDSPSHIVFRRHNPRVRDNPRSDSLTRPPPTPRPVTPARRADAGMASRAVLHPKRRAASPPSPGTGTSPPVTPPKSPNPRAKKAPRGSRATAAGATVRAKKPTRSSSDTKPTRPKKSNKTRSKSLREAAKEALVVLETTARPPRSAEVEKTSVAETTASAPANDDGSQKNDGHHSPPERSPLLAHDASVGDASGDAPRGAARPVWDGRPHNPRAAAASATRPRAYEPTNRKSGSLRRGTTVIRRDPSSVFPTVGTAGTDPENPLRVPTSTPPRVPTVAPLTLNISGDASVAQKALTRKREDEKATKAAAAAAARATARARVASARKRVEETCGRPSRASTVAEASSPSSPLLTTRPRSASHASHFGASRPRTPLGACASAYASERQRAQECLSRRAEFSDALAVKRRRAEARRPTMAYGELCPLNAAREKATFLRAYERYKSGLDVAMPPDPVFEYADPEAARVAMRRWGLPRDEFLAHAERIIARRRELFPPLRKKSQHALVSSDEGGTSKPRGHDETRFDSFARVDDREHDRTHAISDDPAREDPEMDEDDSDDFGETPETPEDDADSFARAAWGERVATQALEEEARRYLARHEIADVVTLRWHDDLSTPSMTTSTSRDPHTGVSIAKGVLHLPRSASGDSDDCADAMKQNLNRGKKFYRKRWIAALLDHEIGTHFAIAANDAAQGDALRDAGAAFGGGPGGVDDARAHAKNANCFPSHKAKSRGFGVAGAATPRERLVTEEGLATLNTHRCAGVKILYGPALAYWTRWHASKLTFCELFEKLEEHVPSANARWTQCVRSKRGLVETKQRKACAKDQCYFEGAVRLLEARRLLDFKLLHGGKIALEEYADAKQAMLRHSQRRGKIARRLGALSKGETSRPASALLSRRDRDATRDRDRDPDDALDAPNYLRGIRGGVSSASLVDAVASALRSQSLMETSASRAVEPHFLADEARYLAELDALAEANGIEAKDDVATRAIAGWAPRRGTRPWGRGAANRAADAEGDFSQEKNPAESVSDADADEADEEDEDAFAGTAAA